jgi:hypothetical protein
MSAALVRSLEPDELLRALRAAIAGLLRETSQVPELAARLAPRLRELTAEWDSALETPLAGADATSRAEDENDR